MKILKNIITGLLLSFAGSIPLGFLNVIGYQIYEASGRESLVSFIFGVISVEIFVIYFTLIFAEKLSKRKRLLKYIELFSILFLLLLAAIFYFYSGSTDSEDALNKYIDYPPYIIGILLSLVNFIQLPFWSGWNLYLVSNGYIITERQLKYYYIAGTLAGTFAGMYGFVFLLDLISGSSSSISDNLMDIIIPLIFLALAIFQTVKFYRKYYTDKLSQ